MYASGCVCILCVSVYWMAWDGKHSEEYGKPRARRGSRQGRKRRSIWGGDGVKVSFTTIIIIIIFYHHRRLRTRVRSFRFLFYFIFRPAFFLTTYIHRNIPTYFVMSL